MSATVHGEHRALLYDEPERFVERVGAFVRAGLGDGDRVLAALVPEKLAWLRDDLGADADRIDVAVAEELYARNGTMFAAIVSYLERSGRRRVRIVAEQALARRGAADVRDYMRYEAASNVVYDRHGASVLCPYDAARLPVDIVDAALRTHPEVLEPDGARPSERFGDPRAFVREHVRASPIPADAVAHPLEHLDDLAGLRRLVRRHAEAAGIAPSDIDGLALAATEVAANAIVHGEPPRRAWVAVVDGALEVRARDAGAGPEDPLAGYLPPDRGGLSGRGLWLAHQVCDVVEIAAGATGTDVRLRLRRSAA